MMKEKNFPLIVSKAVAWLGLLFGLYLFFAWASFSPFDNSFSTANSLDATANSTENLGRMIIDGGYSFFGQVGNFFPFFFFLTSLLWILYGKHLPTSLFTPLRWFVGIILLLCGLSSLATALPLNNDLAYFYSPGGVLGGELASLFEHLGYNNFIFYTIAFIVATIGFFLCDGLIFCRLIKRVYGWIMLKSPQQNQRVNNEQIIKTAENKQKSPLPQEKISSISVAEEKSNEQTQSAKIKIYGLTNTEQSVPLIAEKFIEEDLYPDQYLPEEESSLEQYSPQEDRYSEQSSLEENLPSTEIIKANEASEKIDVKISDTVHSARVVESEVQEIPVIKIPQRESPARQMPQRSTLNMQTQMARRQHLQAQRVMAQFANSQSLFTQQETTQNEVDACHKPQENIQAPKAITVPTITPTPKEHHNIPAVHLVQKTQETETLAPTISSEKENDYLENTPSITINSLRENRKAEIEQAWQDFQKQQQTTSIDSEKMLNNDPNDFVIDDIHDKNDRPLPQNTTETIAFDRSINPFEKKNTSSIELDDKAEHKISPTYQASTVEEQNSQPSSPTVQSAQYKSYGDSLIHPALQKKMDVLEKPTTPMPSIDLLDKHPIETQQITKESLMATAKKIEHLLKDFGIKATVEDVLVGPVVTRYDLALQPGVKASKVTNIESDLARALLFPAIRVAEVIPGKPYVGIETPNQHRQTVFLRDVLDSDAFVKAKSPLSMALGKDISGEPIVVDLASMPHLLVAGATGSGKSVGVNTMILSLLFKVKPEEVKFIMIDPKVVELSVYNGIPHLLTEVVTDMKKAANALRWCVDEMERRYQLLAALSVRNIEGYNEQIKKYNALNMPIPNPLWRPGDTMDTMPPPLEELPYIVVIVDEFADLMMMVGKQVEELIARLAQKARAIGIHLILATQRPSVDVITGLIKANIPTRIAFSVASKIDSRTILDQSGAEALLGRGDMLYAGKNALELTRVHGAFMTDEEVVRIANDWRARGKPNYIDGILDYADDDETNINGNDYNDDELDELFDDVADFIISTGTTSVSALQRRFRIGFNRAARIMDQMEDQGIVSPMQNGKREILSKTTDY